MKLMKWKAIIKRQNQLIVKVAVSILLLCVISRLLFTQSSDLEDNSEAAFIEQTVKARPTDYENGIQVLRNGTQENRNQVSGTGAQENEYRVSGSGSPENRNQVTGNDTQENENQISGNGAQGNIYQVSGNGDQVNANQVSGYGTQENGSQVSLKGPEISIGSLEESVENGDEIPNAGKCDIFTGDWIPTTTGPFYTNKSCSLIEDHQNCMRNGRPDTEYLYWRWKPRDCELPRFNAKQFLELMRNKSWALIGDSITRNHIQSLLCILSKVEQAVQVYHDEEYKSKRWHFPSHNLTISVIWSPFLTKAAIFEDINGVSSADLELHLDKLDPNWIDLYPNLDYVMFSSGKWFVKEAIYYENNTIVGSHGYPHRNLTELGFNTAYQKVIKKVFDFIVSSNHKGMIFYRSSTPDHFENGLWYNGGNCVRTEPVKEGEFKMNELNKYLQEVELEEFDKAKVRASEKGIKLIFLDVMKMSLMRPDGHPGLFRHFHPLTADNSTKLVADCLHWCLPGPIDAWNDLIMEMILNGQE